jgi:hypothetical protein
MELHEFITETLVQIAKGVENANSTLSKCSAVVNPKNVNYNKDGNIRTYGWLTETEERLRAVHLIEFDVLVTATKDKEKKGGIGVAFGNIGIGATRTHGEESIAQNRIKFGIPMVLPNEQKV